MTHRSAEKRILLWWRASSRSIRRRTLKFCRQEISSSRCETIRWLLIFAARPINPKRLLSKWLSPRTTSTTMEVMLRRSSSPQRGELWRVATSLAPILLDKANHSQIASSCRSKIQLSPPEINTKHSPRRNSNKTSQERYKDRRRDRHQGGSLWSKGRGSAIKLLKLRD